MPKLIVTVILAFSVLLGVVSCSAKPAGTTEASAVRSYGDPAAKAMMQAITDRDLAKYAQYGNAQFKAAVTQAVFDQLAAQMAAQFGKFVSNEFLSTENQDQYIIVHYKAQFEKGQLGLRMVFDQDHKVAGQFFE